MDGFWAGAVLVILTVVAYTAVGRVEDVVLRRLGLPERSRVRLAGLGLSALGLAAGWPIPNTNGSADLSLLVSAVLSATALVVCGQVCAVAGFFFGRWLSRWYVAIRRGHAAQAR